MSRGLVSSMAPVDLIVLGAMVGSAKLEHKLHEQFAEWRVHGEWFEANVFLLLYIEQNTKPYNGD